MIPADAVLDSLRAIGDPPADAVISLLFQRGLIKDVNELFKTLASNCQPPDPGNPASVLLQDFLQYTSTLPAFADPALLERGADFFQDHGPQILTVLGAYSLPMDYAARKGVQVLARTGRLSGNPNRRIVETAQMLTDMLQRGAFLPGGSGICAIQKVRLIHAAVRHLILKRDPTWRGEYGTPINQEDMAGTNLSFSYAVIEGLQRLGMSPDAADAEAYFHCFRVAGHLLGIQPQLIASSLAEAKELAQRIRQRQFGPSAEGREMTAALLRLMEETYPWPLQGTGPALMRFLLEDQVADMLGVPPTPWTARELEKIEQRFYGHAEAAANTSAVLRKLRHSLSHWYLTHLQIIDRGPGRGQLQIPDYLSKSWQGAATAKSVTTHLLLRPTEELPRPALLRSIEHPVDRNREITQSYHALSEAMGRLLGEPRIADWCTFAKFASHQAGVHIRETSLTARRLLAALWDTSIPGKLGRIAEEIVAMPATFSMARRLLELCLRRSQLSDGIDGVRDSQRGRLSTALGEFQAAAARLNRCFFMGNMYVYENIAPAYCAYLRAAQISPNGIPAEVPPLAQEVDPVGYLRRGLECYRQAQLCWLRGELPARDRLVSEGNLWLGLHEQGCILQPLFDGVREELQTLSENIYVHDARATTRMLPEGGDWGDLLDRMGIDGEHAEAQPWTALPPLRTGVHFAGTIAAYFQDGLYSKELIYSRPSDVYPMGKVLLDGLLDEERSVA